MTVRWRRFAVYGVLGILAVWWLIESGHLWSSRYQLASHAPFIVRLDTRTGELRAFVVGSKSETMRVAEYGVVIREVGKLVVER
jgi:hypothetical protein